VILIRENLVQERALWYESVGIPKAEAEYHCELLRSCYFSCFELSEQSQIKSIAFCCISTGVFGFQNEIAAKIAVETVLEYKQRNNSRIKVIFNVFQEEDEKIYEKLLL